AMLAPRPQLGEVPRTLGWRGANPDDTHLHGAPSASSVGHTGFTGTCLWIDRASETFVILLTNRVHMGHDAEIGILRRRVGEIVGEFIEESAG
ncbi:MAG: serine hydrolase, partial [Armatimonadota bacterium]